MLRNLGVSFLVLIIILIIGTSGLVLFEGLSVFDAFYFTVETITTVGYGDIDIHTLAGRVFLIFLMFCGAAVIFYIFGLAMTFFIEGQFFNLHGRIKMKRQIDRLFNHIIVCGAGRVGIQVVNSLLEEKAEFVVIEQNEELVKQLACRGILVIIGNAVNDETLTSAGIKRAKGLVTTLPDDSENVYVTLTAKELNPQIEVVARTNSPDSETKLLRAGADKVVSPASLGGKRMAMFILNPACVEYFDFIVKNSDFKILEIVINSNSVLVNKKIAEVEFLRNKKITLLAIVRNKQVLNILKTEETLQANDILILFGDKKELQQIKESSYL